MKNRFAQLAKNETTLSHIMEERALKMSIEEVIERYPNGFTVIDFDMITTDGSTYPVMAIKEDENAYFFGGVVFAKIALAWVKEFEGDITAASEELSKSGGVKMRAYVDKTKTNRKITKVEILEE